MRIPARDLSVGDRSEFGPVVGVSDGGSNRAGVATVLVTVRWSSAGEGLQFDLVADRPVEVSS